MVKRRCCITARCCLTPICPPRTLADGAAQGCLQGDGVNPWPVTNLRTVLPQFDTTEQFFDALYAELDKAFLSKKNAPKEGRSSGQKIAEEKYHDWDWTFGGGPGFERTRTIQTPEGTFPLSFTVKKGIIQEVKSEQPAFTALNGHRFEPETVRHIIGSRSVAEQLF